MQILSSKTARQTYLLFGSQLFIILIGFGIKSLQTKFLGPELYGIYALFGSFTGFSVLFFRFGFYSSIQVLLAETNSLEKERNYFGAGFLISFFIGIVYALFIWISSFYINTIFKTELIGEILQITAPLAIILPLRQLVSAMSIGSNRLERMVIYDNVSKILFFVALLVFALSDSLGVFVTIVFNLVSLIVAGWIVYRMFQPSFKNLKPVFHEIWQKNKIFGFKFYLGTTANQSTFKLDELLISFFNGTTLNGFYTLATVVCSPMVMASQSLSNAMFKRFSGARKIPDKVFILNTAWLIVSMLGLYLLVDYIVAIIFGESYQLVADFAVWLSVAYFFQGLYQPFNFLSAKSQGNAVRNVAFTEAGINLLGNLALIPVLGVMGAIYTSIAAKLIHFIGKVYYYKKYLRENP